MITGAKVLELLDKAVEEKGADYVYPALVGMAVDDYDHPDISYSPWRDKFGRCLYRNSETNEPACIVGKVLSYVNLLDLVAEGASVLQQGEELLGNFDGDAMIALVTAQNSQDNGSSWGEAVESARRVL